MTGPLEWPEIDLLDILDLQLLDTKDDNGYPLLLFTFVLKPDDGPESKVRGWAKRIIRDGAGVGNVTSLSDGEHQKLADRNDIQMLACEGKNAVTHL